MRGAAPCASVAAKPESGGTAGDSSLVVITLNSAAGLLGHRSDGGLNWWLIGLLLAGGVPGLLLGARLARQLPATQLRQGFALFVVLLGVTLLLINVPIALR